MSTQDSISVRCYGMMQSQGGMRVELLQGTSTLSISVGSGDVHLMISVDDWRKLCNSVEDVLNPVTTHRIVFNDMAGTATVVSE